MKRREFLELSGHTAFLAAFPYSAYGKSASTGTFQTGLFMDDQFLDHVISKEHPDSPARYIAIKHALQNSGLFEKTAIVNPVKDVERWIKTIHTPAHVQSIREYYGEQTNANVSLVTAGLLGAVDEVCSGSIKNAFCASRPPGHHALNTGREEGFCYYNHIAIAARYAQQKLGLKKILIADWDYHHGNGTEAAFYSDPSVLFFSTHDMDAYPLTGSSDRKGAGAGEGYNINVHLGCGASDKDITQAFLTQLVPAANTFKPDLILISAGFDSRENDLLGCHNVTDKGFIQLTEIIKKLAEKHCQGKVVSILEGGYNIKGTASAVVSHITTLMS